MAKREHKVSYKKLGQQQCWGIAYIGENKLTVDERLQGYRLLLYLLHEHFHLKHPDWSETKIRKESSLTARFLWQQKFRWVDL
jgi:hypothetical protein